VGVGRKINININNNININIVALTSLPLCNLALSLDSEIGVITRLGEGIYRKCFFYFRPPAKVFSPSQIIQIASWPTQCNIEGVSVAFPPGGGGNGPFSKVGCPPPTSIVAKRDWNCTYISHMHYKIQRESLPVDSSLRRLAKYMKINRQYY
jgi:hypothetical protein